MLGTYIDNYVSVFWS